MANLFSVIPNESSGDGYNVIFEEGDGEFQLQRTVRSSYSVLLEAVGWFTMMWVMGVGYAIVDPNSWSFAAEQAASLTLSLLVVLLGQERGESVNLNRQPETVNIEDLNVEKNADVVLWTWTTRDRRMRQHQLYFAVTIPTLPKQTELRFSRRQDAESVARRVANHIGRSVQEQESHLRAWPFFLTVMLGFATGVVSSITFMPYDEWMSAIIFLPYSDEWVNIVRIGLHITVQVVSLLVCYFSAFYIASAVAARQYR